MVHVTLNSTVAFVRFICSKLGGNFLSGSLPPSWSALTSMERLEVEGNALLATLPPSWAAMTRLEHL
jgi:hypothetical protein